jgi:hypothetical protein
MRRRFCYHSNHHFPTSFFESQSDAIVQPDMKWGVIQALNYADFIIYQNLKSAQQIGYLLRMTKKLIVRVCNRAISNQFSVIGMKKILRVTDQFGLYFLHYWSHKRHYYLALIQNKAGIHHNLG